MDKLNNMQLETRLEIKNKSTIKGLSRLFYHIPPTAIPIDRSDFSQAIKAILNPSGSIENFVSATIKKTENQNCFLSPSGRSALLIILLTLKRISNRLKVIVPAYTCPTVIQSVLEAGLQPVFCDVSTETIDLDRVALCEELDDDVLAIIPTHLYGLAQDVSDLVRICQQFDIFLIEDAAQAFGATVQQRMVGNAGDFGFFSLGRGKAVPTGHGGIIFTKDKYATYLSETIDAVLPGGIKRDFASIFRYLAYGLATTPTAWWFIFRSPFNPASDGMDLEALSSIKMENPSAVQAGIGISILNRIEQITSIRRDNAQRLINLLSSYDFVRTPRIFEGGRPIFLRLPIIVDDQPRADLLYDLLSRKGIGVSRSYYRTLPEMFARSITTDLTKFPGAKHLAECMLTLPTHHYLDENDFIRIQNVLDLIPT